MNPHVLQKLCLKKLTNPARNEPTTTAPEPPALSRSSTINEPTAAAAQQEPDAAVDIKRVGRELEEFVRNRRLAIEEKMFERFYLMRIEQSRKFIELIKKINKSWDDFVEYLKSIGAQGLSGDGDCTVYSLTNNSSLTALSQVCNDESN